MATLPSPSGDQGQHRTHHSARARGRMRRACTRDAGSVLHVVDPRPQVKATLDDLAAQFQSELEDLERALAAARTRDEARGMRQRRREVRRRYRAAKREVTRILRFRSPGERHHQARATIGPQRWP